MQILMVSVLTDKLQLDSQEDMIKNSSYPNPELMLINLIFSQIQLDYGAAYPLKQYMHTQSTVL